MVKTRTQRQAGGDSPTSEDSSENREASGTQNGRRGGSLPGSPRGIAAPSGTRKVRGRGKNPASKPVSGKKDRKSLPGQPKPHRYRPGTRALMECHRFDAPLTLAEQRDRGYYGPKLSPQELGEKPNTRQDARVFFKVANVLPVLNDEHEPDHEASQYRSFISRIEATITPTNLEEGSKQSYYESPSAIWLSTIVRYKNKHLKDLTIKHNNEKEFWRLNNGCPSTSAIDIRLLLGKNKPICVLVGHKQWKKPDGHVVAVVILQSSEGRRMIVKDSLDIDETRVKALVYDLALKLNIHKIDLVGMLDVEEAVSYTECLRESFKVVGNILDGTFFWNLNISPFTRTYGTKSERPIKIKSQRRKLTRKPVLDEESTVDSPRLYSLRSSGLNKDI